MTEKDYKSAKSDSSSDQEKDILEEKLSPEQVKEIKKTSIDLLKLVEGYTEDQNKRIAEAIRPLSESLLSAQRNMLTKIQESIKLPDSYFKNLSTISKSMNESFQSISKAFLNSYSSKIKEVVEKISGSLTLPDIGEEEKAKILSSYKQWGEFRWSVIDAASP